MPCSSFPILTGFVFQVKAAILFFPLLLSHICKSEAVLGKKKKTTTRRIQEDLWQQGQCGTGRFETDKALIWPVWIIFGSVLLPVYRFAFLTSDFQGKVSRKLSPCVHKGLLVFHLQMFPGW